MAADLDPAVAGAREDVRRLGVLRQALARRPDRVDPLVDLDDLAAQGLEQAPHGDGDDEPAAERRAPGDEILLGARAPHDPSTPSLSR
jgi:hypothetical protein